VPGSDHRLELHHQIDIDVLFVFVQIGVPDAAMRATARGTAMGADAGRNPKSIPNPEASTLRRLCHL
jgi:hypothetical protein